MSFSGFVFDMIRRDKENRDLRNLRRERSKERVNKMFKGHNSMPQNITAEEMKMIQKKTVEKEQSELQYRTRMTFTILSVCIIVVSLVVYLFIS